VGRGKGSGYGKMSGRGMKGQRRLGGLRVGFEGGQTPLHRRIPKRYVLKKTRFPTVPVQPLNLNRLQLWIDMGRLNPEQTITMKHLYDSGIVGKFQSGVKLLGGVCSSSCCANRLG
jgi:large subunit ribosomal protein L15